MERPTSVTVFGVLNIVFAGLGLVGGCCGMAAMAGPNAARMLPAIHHPVFHGWFIFANVVGFIFAIALGASGIGLLALKAWARLLSITYAVCALAMGAVNVVFLVPALISQAGGRHGPQAVWAMGAAIGGTFGGCLVFAYPILLLIFMTRPNVVAAFKGQTDIQSETL